MSSGGGARRRPVLVLCGPPGSGKTTVARALAGRLGLERLSGDVVHKELLGLRPTDRVARAAHTDALARRTYAELGRRAAASPGAIVDATFGRAVDRATFAAAGGERLAPLFVECIAPAAVLAERTRRRLLDPSRVSDATPGFAEAHRRSYEPLDELDSPARATVRTDRPLAEVVREVEALFRAATR